MEKWGSKKTERMYGLMTLRKSLFFHSIFASKTRSLADNCRFADNLATLTLREDGNAPEDGNQLVFSL